MRASSTLFLFFALSVAPAAAYEGSGIMNLVVVGEDYSLEDIREIKSFIAVRSQSQDDLSYMLTLDGDTKLTHPDSGVVPTLILRDEGKIVASAHLRVLNWEKENELIMEWMAVPEFDDDSYCMVQINPNTDEMAMLKIPFSAATVVTREAGRRRTMTMAEFRKDLAKDTARISPEEKKDATPSQDESPDEAVHRGWKELQDQSKTLMISPDAVTLHRFAVGHFDAEGNFEACDFIPLEAGRNFGYQLWVHSTSGKVHVKEIFEVPKARSWEDFEEGADPPGMRTINVEVAQAGKVRITEYELVCGDQAIQYGGAYHVDEADPEGEYKFTILLNGQHAEEATLRLEIPARDQQEADR